MKQIVLVLGLTALTVLVSCKSKKGDSSAAPSPVPAGYYAADAVVDGRVLLIESSDFCEQAELRIRENGISQDQAEIYFKQLEGDPIMIIDQKGNVEFASTFYFSLPLESSQQPNGTRSSISHANGILDAHGRLDSPRMNEMVEEARKKGRSSSYQFTVKPTGAGKVIVSGTSSGIYEGNSRRSDFSERFTRLSDVHQTMLLDKARACLAAKLKK